MFTKLFWLDILTRAIKTLCQSSVAVLVAAGSGLVDTDYVGLLSVAGMAALVSVLTNVGGAPSFKVPAPGAEEAVSYGHAPPAEAGKG